MDSSLYNERICACGAALVGKQRTTCAECRRRRNNAGDRHQKRSDGKRAKRSKKPARYAGIDGESIDGEYVMLSWATDDGQSAVLEHRTRTPLTTKECLSFVCAVPKGVKVWGFAFGYDVNMMLGDIPESQIRKLHETNQLGWANFYIHYIPTCMFQVTETLPDRTKRTTTIWDLWKWVQTSFATWIGPDRKAGGWDLAPAEDVERVLTMKGLRSGFSDDQWDDIRRYNLTECEYMAIGARRLCDLITDSGINVQGRYHSFASLAKALMRRHNVNDYRAPVPAALAKPVIEAYFGGRAEVSDIGPIDGPVYGYDINSAYPSATVGLPCLACGRWRQSTPARDGRVVPWSSVKPWSLVRVSWRPLRGAHQPKWGPLPFRPVTGSNSWPTHGTGWFWGVEVLAARRHATITVKDCWTYSTPCAHRPFGYLSDLYAQRQLLKASADPLEFVLKGALNSTYGALAEAPKHNSKAPYRCMIWAGWITAATRAALLDVLDDDVVLMATDGILRRSPLGVAVSKQMGDWDAEVYDGAWVAGTGIYFARKGDVWEKNKTRGFTSGTLTREDFMLAWATDGRTAQFKVPRTIFIGMGVALHRVRGMRPPHARLWRTFLDQRIDKTLDPAPRRIWIVDDERDGRTRAPSLKLSKEQQRIDASLVRDWYDEYRATLARLDKIQRAGPSDIAVVNTVTGWKETELLDRLMTLATMIEEAERNHHSPLIVVEPVDPTVA